MPAAAMAAAAHGAGPCKCVFLLLPLPQLVPPQSAMSARTRHPPHLQQHPGHSSTSSPCHQHPAVATLFIDSACHNCCCRCLQLLKDIASCTATAAPRRLRTPESCGPSWQPAWPSSPCLQEHMHCHVSKPIVPGSTACKQCAKLKRSGHSRSSCWDEPDSAPNTPSTEPPSC
jgi:hypothetical protein